MNSPTIDHTSNRNSTKHPARTCLYGNWNILITFTRHQNGPATPKDLNDLQILLFYFQLCSLWLFSMFLTKLCFRSSFQTDLKGCGLIRKFGINPMKIRSIFCVVWQLFSFSEVMRLFHSFLADRTKRSANSPENYPFFLIRQLLKLLMSEDTYISRTFTLNQNFRFCKVRTHYKMQATHKVFAQAIYPLMKFSIA